MFRGVKAVAHAMLQQRFDTALEKNMKLAHLISTFALAATATGCKAERTPMPQPVQHVASSATPNLPQVPLLFVVDGVRLQRDQVPKLADDQIAAVRVIKGRVALKRYGPDASYGVVLITTKGATPRS
jgi:hypothetical protein